MKKNLYLTISTFLLVAILETIINQLLLKDTYSSLKSIWRPDEDLKSYAPIFLGIYLVFSIGFAKLFSNSYRGNGIIEGLVIGLCIGAIAKFWYGYTNYIVLPIPHELAFQWFFYGMIESVIIGIASAFILDKTK
ncbi:MAG: hypothetical protein SFU98_12670 [Leptospiraceae bacterium]|nr:hypothetical protein [Leptospiraceae bacterium]